MIHHYLKAAFRSLFKERLYTIINAVGLAIGLATCFIIYSWVSYEYSYDRHFPDNDKVYRVVTREKERNEKGIASTYPMVRTRILSQFPEVEVSGRFYNEGLLGGKTRVAYQDNVFTNNTLYYGDSTVLRLFNFKLLRGDANALRKPNAVILSQTTANKIFGEDDPIGKVILIGTDKEFEVTGVMEDLPANTHFHFDLLASMLAHPWIKGAEDNVWSGVVFHTYLKLKDGSSAVALENKIADMLEHFPNDPKGFGKQINLQLQPLLDIHLRSSMKFELDVNGNISYVRLFVIIAVLILFVAIMNYINLTTSRHTQRYKEVGVRKVTGASRGQLIAQFITESLAITLFAFLLGALLVEVAKPFIRNMANQDDFIKSLLDPIVLLVAGSVTLMIGLLSAVFPALALSSFKPVRLFKGHLYIPGRGLTIRKALVISQFTISIALTICTAITYQQVNFLREAKLGYDLDHTVVLNIDYPEVRAKYELLKTKLGSHSSILGATATSQLPTDVQTGENIDVGQSEPHGVNCMSVDPDFFGLMNVSVKQEAQVLSSIRANDSLNYFVLNKQALASIGWSEEEALKKTISIRHGNQKPGAVVGVIDDFHFQSLHHPIGPLVLEFDPGQFQYLLVKIKGGDPEEALSFIASQWKEIAPAIPFDYTFLDEEYNNLYRNERRSANLFVFFSSIALLVSLMGLFGLSSFSAERRTKEFGIRRILGARVSSILGLLSREFLLLLSISFLFAVPLAYYFMTSWLSTFAFKTEISPQLFLLSGCLNFLLSILTILYHGLKVARTRPVETLKNE